MQVALFSKLLKSINEGFLKPCCSKIMRVHVYHFTSVYLLQPLLINFLFIKSSYFQTYPQFNLLFTKQLQQWYHQGSIEPRCSEKFMTEFSSINMINMIISFAFIQCKKYWLLFCDEMNYAQRCILYKFWTRKSYMINKK